MAGKKLTAIERFWSYVDKATTPDGCWTWTGYCNPNGYAKFWTGTRYQGGHVFSYANLVGEVAPGLSVLHRCDNKPCVRPDHLFAGTQQENMTDKTAKGRQAHSGRCGRTRLTIEQVREIRHALATQPMYPEGRSLGHRAGSRPGLRTLLAEKYGVSVLTIWKIGRRDQWKHVE